MDRQQRKAHAHGCSADPVGTAAGVAGVGADAGGRVHRSQRGAGGEGVRVVLPAGDRRRRVHARSIRSSIITCHVRLGLRGDALTVTQERSRRPTTCARRPACSGSCSRSSSPARSRRRCSASTSMRGGDLATAAPRCTGVAWCAWWRCWSPWRCSVVSATTSTVGSSRALRRRRAGGDVGVWWFSAWFLLLGEVRARVLVPTGVITGVATAAYAASATIWMPEVVTSNEAQFGVFGVALALVTWFSGRPSASWSGPAPEWSSPRTRDGSARSSAAPSRRPSPRAPAHRCQHPPAS